MSEPLHVTYRHGNSPDRNVLRVIVEGVDVGAIERAVTGGWRAHRPELVRKPTRKPDRASAAADVLRRRQGFNADKAQRAVDGTLSEEERNELLIALGVRRARQPVREPQ
jgi:hypothetical protein